MNGSTTSVSPSAAYGSKKKYSSRGNGSETSWGPCSGANIIKLMTLSAATQKASTFPENLPNPISLNTRKQTTNKITNTMLPFCFRCILALSRPIRWFESSRPDHLQ
jgi:hypothetical protein